MNSQIKWSKMKSIYNFKWKTIYSIVTISLITFLVNIPSLSMKTFNNMDEFTSLAVPAYLAGYDWSSIVSLETFHGFGFTILLTPFLGFLETSEAIYFILILLALFVRIGCAIIIYLILNNELNSKQFSSVIISIAFSIGTLSPDNACTLSALSEGPLALIFLLVIYFILIANRTKGKKKIVFSVLVGGILAYSYTIHSRCLIIYLSIIIVYFLYYIFFRKNMLHVRGTCLGFFIVLTICILANNYLKTNLYQISSGQVLPNDTSTVLMSISYLFFRLFEWNAIKSCIVTVFSLLSTTVLISGGAVCVFLSGCCIAIFHIFKEKKLQPKDGSLFIISMLGLVTIIAMTISIALVSAYQVVDGDNKWLTYIRYCMPFWGPVLVSGGYVLLEKKEYCKKMLFSGAISFIVILIFINTLMSKMLSKSYGLGYSVINRIFYYDYDHSVTEYLAAFSIVVFALFILGLYLIYTKKPQLFVMLFIIFSLGITMKQTEFYLLRNKVLQERTNGTVAMLQEYDLNKKINVVCDNTEEFAMYLQFAMFNRPLKATENIKEVDLKYSALLSNVDYSKKQLTSDYKMPLDNNEFLYTNNYELYMFLKEKSENANE